MKRIRLLTITAATALFGLLTIFMSSSVIFDLFNIRAAQGNYVPFVVWANLLSGILFVVAATAFFAGKKWSARPLIASLIILGVTLVGLLIHIYAGGAFETKTVAAMAFRIAVNGVLALMVYASVRKHQTPRFREMSMLSVLPLILLATSCGGRPDSADGHHHAVESATSHDHEGAFEPLSLNNGEKWEADAHTASVVADMKSELADFSSSGSANHHVLADSLTRQLNVLIAGCTMAGPAHDELHKWLVPVTKSIGDLAAAQNLTAARAEVDRIEHSLHEFDAFFE